MGERDTAKRLEAEAGLTPETAAAWGRSLGCCVYCGKSLWKDERAYTLGAVDYLLPKHLFPDSASDQRNMVLSCGVCSALKGHYNPLNDTDDPEDMLGAGRDVLLSRVRRYIGERAREKRLVAERVRDVLRDKERIFTGCFLVIYYDLLGQSAELRSIRKLPKSEAEFGVFIRRLQATVGNVLATRELFVGYFRTPPLPDLSLVKPRQAERFVAALRRIDPIIYGLSDATVIAVPLRYTNEEEDCAALNAVFDSLLATGAIMLHQLSIGVPVRVGMDVGVATLIDADEVYGPVLEKAVHLESEVAHSPRAVVGSGLVDYLESHVMPDAVDPLLMCMSSTAFTGRTMITPDNDGVDILDFMGSSLKTAFSGRLEPDLFDKVLKSALKKQQEYSLLRNTEVAGKYSCLASYCLSRRDVWKAASS